MKHHMARRVAGAVIHIKHQIADFYLIALHQPAIGFKHHAVDAISPAIIGQPRDPEPVSLMRPLNRHAQFLGQHTRFAAMVDMAVRQDDLFDGDAVMRHCRAQLGQIATRIDKGTAHRGGAPHQCAVLGERGDGNDGGTHGRRGRLGGRVGHTLTNMSAYPRRQAPCIHARACPALPRDAFGG